MGKEKKEKKKEKKKSKKSTTVVKVERDDGVVHAFSEEEKQGIVDHVNLMMADDDSYVPIDPASMDIFKRMMNGVLLCSLVNAAEPDTIPPRKINRKKKLNRFEINDNIDAGLAGAKALKLQIVNMGPEDFISGTAFHLVLGVLWQIVRLDLLNSLDRAKAGMSALLGTDESALDALVPEQVLLLWVNYHLEKAGCERRMTNFGTDIKDSEIYTRLLHQLQPKTFNLSPLDTSDLTERATLLLKEANKEKLDKFVNASDIVKGNARLNFAFVATLFSHFQDSGDASTESEEEDIDEEELGAWRGDLEELETELFEKEQQAALADAKLAELKAQRDAARAAHQAEIDALTAELERMAAAEPQTKDERELADQLANEQRHKLALVAKQTDLLRKAADLTDKLEDEEDEAARLLEMRQKAEMDINEFKRKHKSDMSAVRRRLAQAKLEEEMLEQELEHQTEERNKLKEERSGLQRKYKDLSIKLEVETIDRIQTQSAKDKLDRQLFHAKQYLTEAKADRKVKEKKKKILTRNVRKLKETKEVVLQEKQVVLTEVSFLNEENKELGEEVIIEHKAALRSKNVRRTLEETVVALKQQLEEDEEFHNAVKEETVKKHEQKTVQLATNVVKDLGRKQQLLELAEKEAEELQSDVKQTKQVTEQLAEATHQIKRETTQLEGQVDMVNTEKAAIDKKRRKLEKQLRKARRLIQDQTKTQTVVEREKKLAAQKKLEAEKLAARARLAVETAEKEKRMAEIEVLDTADAVDAEAAEKARIALEARLLEEEAEELEEERVRLALEKERVLAKVQREAREDKIAAQAAAQLKLMDTEEAREEAHASALQAAVLLEAEKGEKALLERDKELLAEAAAQAEREAKAMATKAALEIEDAKELRNETKAEKERARAEREARLEAEKKAAALAVEHASAHAETQRALDEKVRLEQRAKQLEEEAKRIRLDKAATRGAAAVLEEQADEAASRAKRDAIAQEKRAAKAEIEEVRIQKRLEAEKLKAKVDKDKSKLEMKTKSLEERLAEADAQLEAERAARLAAEKNGHGDDDDEDDE